MVKPITKSRVLDMGKAIADYTEKNHTLPNSLTYDAKTYYRLEFAYIVSYAPFHLNKDIIVPNFNKYDDITLDKVSDKVWKSDFMDMSKRVYTYIETNKRVPNYVTSKKGYKINMTQHIYNMAKVIRYYKEHQELPAYCMYDYSIFNKPKTYSEQILDYFTSKFGTVNSIDTALGKIQGKGYGYYYDDQYTNKQSIDRMKNGHGVNCTDSCHVFWHIGKALGYDVRAIHVRCRGGDGHIRLQFNKNNTGWFNRDPAAVLDGKSVDGIWCSNGTYLATNPQWFLNNLNR